MTTLYSRGYPVQCHSVRVYVIHGRELAQCRYGDCMATHNRGGGFLSHVPTFQPCPLILTAHQEAEGGGGGGGGGGYRCEGGEDTEMRTLFMKLPEK